MDAVKRGKDESAGLVEQASDLASSPVSREPSVQAMRAIGAVVQIAGKDFEALLARIERPVVVVGRAGFFRNRYTFLTSHGGFIFAARSEQMLTIPRGAEVVRAKKVWLPE